MPIEITFVADNAEDLVEQVLAFAKRLTANAKPQEAPAARSPEPVLASQEGDIKPAEITATESEQEKQPVKRRHRRVNPKPLEAGTGAGAPEPLTNGATPVPEASAPGHTPSQPVDILEKTEALSEAMQEIIAPATPPKEALELKESVINSLQEAFRAGKITKVRQVLTQYGNGAKSFREIDISAFPEINKALKAGALN